MCIPLILREDKNWNYHKEKHQGRSLKICFWNTFPQRIRFVRSKRKTTVSKLQKKSLQNLIHEQKVKFRL